MVENVKKVAEKKPPKTNMTKKAKKQDKSDESNSEPEEPVKVKTKRTQRAAPKKQANKVVQDVEDDDVLEKIEETNLEPNELTSEKQVRFFNLMVKTSKLFFPY